MIQSILRSQGVARKKQKIYLRPNIPVIGFLFNIRLVEFCLFFIEWAANKLISPICFLNILTESMVCSAGKNEGGKSKFRPMF